MESGWIINFKDGFRAILTEDQYKIYERSQDMDKVEYEEHWFSLAEAKRKNPDVYVMEG